MCQEEILSALLRDDRAQREGAKEPKKERDGEAEWRENRSEREGTRWHDGNQSETHFAKREG